MPWEIWDPVLCGWRKTNKDDRPTNQTCPVCGEVIPDSAFTIETED